MRSNAICARGNGDLGGFQRIGMPPATRITHGRNVIDIHAKANGRVRCHEILVAPARTA
jgi:hypothetical protein